MDRATESSTLRQPLPRSEVAKIFQAMQGNYGSRFLNQWKTGQTIKRGEHHGKDVGLVNAMAFWGDKLAGFADQPERIAYVLNTLPEEPPSLPQFVKRCNEAPAKEVQSLRYVPTADDHKRARIAAEKASQVVKKINGDGIDTHWATHPRSVRHLKFIFEAAASDQRFRPCITEMVETGICTEDGHLLKSYRDQQWLPIVRSAA